MKAKRRDSSAHGRRVRESGRHVSADGSRIPDDVIDFSDIPQLSDEQLGAMQRVGRPPTGDATKVPIAFRINPTLLSCIRELAAERGKPYQSLMHDLLEKGAARLARSKPLRVTGPGAS